MKIITAEELLTVLKNEYPETYRNLLFEKKEHGQICYLSEDVEIRWEKTEIVNTNPHLILIYNQREYLLKAVIEKYREIDDMYVFTLHYSEDKYKTIDDLIKAMSLNKTGRENRIDGFLKKLPKELHFSPTDEYGEEYRDRTLIQFVPSNKQLIIYPLNQAKKTKSGISILEFDQEAPVDKRSDSSSYYGMIVSAAPDALHHNDKPFNAGDICLFAKQRETYIDYGPIKLLLIGQYDCWGIVPENLYYNYQFDAKGDVYQNIRYMFTTAEAIKEKERKAVGK